MCPCHRYSFGGGGKWRGILESAFTVHQFHLVIADIRPVDHHRKLYRRGRILLQTGGAELVRNGRHTVKQIVQDGGPPNHRPYSLSHGILTALDGIFDGQTPLPLGICHLITARSTRLEPLERVDNTRLLIGSLRSITMIVPRRATPMGLFAESCAPVTDSASQLTS